jgi:hypothetical protein
MAMERKNTDLAYFRCRPSRTAATLLDLVVSMTIVGILVTGLHACIAISLRSIPDPQGPTVSAVTANGIAELFVSELETAVHITDRTATSIGFTLPDRDGDGRDERVRYVWTGVPGGALTRQVNDGVAIVLADSVHSFLLTPSVRSVSETVPSIGIEDPVDTLLVDTYATSGTGDMSVTSSNWVGQHLQYTPPTGAYAWRPTRLELMLKRESAFALTRLQIQPATINLTPAATVDEQFLLLGTLLPSNYAWIPFSLQQGMPMNPGDAFCLVLKHEFGSKSLSAQRASHAPGSLQSGNAGATWSYHPSRCLVYRLYGKLTRSFGTETLTSHYLTSVHAQLRMAETAPRLSWSADCLNHPELLDNLWESDFARDATDIDINGDGQADWGVVGSGSIDPASFSDDGWRSEDKMIRTQPTNAFFADTTIDLELQSLTTGGNGATFKINLMNADSRCAPVVVHVQKQTDGTQLLTLDTKTSGMVTKTLLRIVHLPPQPVRIRLDLHAATSCLAIRVNDAQYGSHELTRILDSGSDAFATLGSDGGESMISYARIRVREATEN